MRGLICSVFHVSFPLQVEPSRPSIVPAPFQNLCAAFRGFSSRSNGAHKSRRRSSKGKPRDTRLSRLDRAAHKRRLQPTAGAGSASEARFVGVAKAQIPGSAGRCQERPPGLPWSLPPTISPQVWDSLVRRSHTNSSRKNRSIQLDVYSGSDRFAAGPPGRPGKEAHK